MSKREPETSIVGSLQTTTPEGIKAQAIETSQTTAYYTELERRVKTMEAEERQALQKAAADKQESAKAAADKKPSYMSYILAGAITATTLFISTLSIAASYSLLPALALISLTAITSKGIFRFLSAHETFTDSIISPFQPIKDLWHCLSAKDKESRKKAWNDFLDSTPQVLGALALGLAVAKATFTQMSGSGLLSIPLPAAMILAVTMGVWNYTMGADAFAPAKSSTDKDVSFVGKMKDYWHQFRTENKWERGFRLMGHAFALTAGLALLATMTAGTGGALFYVMLTAGIVQTIGLQRTSIPRLFVHMGSALLRPFGVHINTPKSAAELAWSCAPKKTKILALLGVSIGISTSAYLMVQGFASIGLFASIGFPPVAAAIVTATFLGILSYQLLQRFYLSRLSKKKQEHFKSMAYADKRQDAMQRAPEKLKSMLKQEKKASSENIGWTASKDDVLENHLDYFLTEDTKTAATATETAGPALKNDDFRPKPNQD